ncbi:MAG TPA: M23 family metallopeptidase [Gaiellaceae bacterium]|nr:M23 family metallopeptidase [Gaiellaceae bacterium]
MRRGATLLVLAASALLAAGAGAASREVSVLSVPPLVTPPLGPGARVFPAFGAVYASDTFGAGRGDVAGGWHHGDDLFAPVGTPVLACADGLVFSVGWNRVGGWRLWLVDGEGNEFYYAHLSGYSAFAVDGAVVHAGDVLGFVGDTGDARDTPPHLHFEVHPVSLLELGYDGAVDPDPYLKTWRRAAAIPKRARGGWTRRPAARPAAVLVAATDISAASGLDLDALARAAGR